MTFSLRRLAILSLLGPAPVAIAALSLTAAHAQTPADPRDALPGKDVFDLRCAACHMHPELSHAVPFATLRTFPADRINTALTTGVMRMQGASLSDEDRDQVVAYLAAPGASTVTTTTTTTTTPAPTAPPGR